MANDKTYEDRVVRITELVDIDGLLDGFTFINCEISGPAVIVPSASQITGADTGAPADWFLWELPLVAGRIQKVGAILAQNCVFERCRFRNVGLAGPTDFVQEFQQSMGQ
jgi:hypothetical protein